MTSQNPSVPVEPAEAGWSWAPFIVFGLGLIVAGLFVVVVAPPSNEGIEATAALAFIAALALGVERLVELIFGIVDRQQFAGGWWPLKQVRESILNYEKNTNAVISEPLASLKSQLEELKTQADQIASFPDDLKTAISDALADIDDTTDDLAKRVQEAQKLAPGSPRLTMLTDVAADAVGAVDRAASLIDDVVQNQPLNLAEPTKEFVARAKQFAAACDRGVDVVATFTDNPARRVLSLAIGATAGLLVAGFLGLNLFLAVLQEPAPDGTVPKIEECKLDDPVACFSGEAGILLTGVVIGLGANPTHEIISGLRKREGERRARLANTAARAARPSARPAAAGMAASPSVQAPPVVVSARTRSVRNTA